MAPELLGQLIDQLGPALILYARQWCAAPEDVVQEALLKLSVARMPLADPKAWLYRTVRNGAISAGRSERRRHKHEQAAAHGRDWFAPVEASRIDANAVTAALTKLADDEREIIVARIWGGLSFEQIALLMRTSAATAHRRYVSGLEQLRRIVGGACPSYPPT